jgi:hypothetical protein
MTEATISRGSISIRVPEKAMRQLVEGAWALDALEVRQRITDAPVFMQELVNILNAEDEQGTTLIHKMFDAAINEALEQGAEGIEDHPDQDA